MRSKYPISPSNKYVAPLVVSIQIPIKKNCHFLRHNDRTNICFFFELHTDQRISNKTPKETLLFIMFFKVIFNKLY